MNTRWVGSPQGRDFPAALLRFGACLGIEIQVCAPHHPQQNAFVERYHRTYQEECLALDQPADLEHATDATAAFVKHYNVERPHQGLSCGNRPPQTAFPQLPALPALPTTVDPDSWLTQLYSLHLERKVDRHGMISLDLKRYYWTVSYLLQTISSYQSRAKKQDRKNKNRLSRINSSITKPSISSR